MFSTVRIETESPEGIGSGTGFAIASHHAGGSAPFLVTNRHVVDTATSGRIYFVLREGSGPAVGDITAIQFDEFSKLWHGHPDPKVDIAVAPMAPVLRQLERAGHEVYCPVLDQGLIPSVAEIDALDTSLDVLILGFPDAFADPENGVPLIQRASTVSPIQLPYRGHPAFVVDAPAYCTSAGSPVLAVERTPETVGDRIVFVKRFLLIGVLAHAGFLTTEGIFESRPIPTTRIVAGSPHMLSLAIAFNSACILEAILDFVGRMERETGARAD